MATICCGTMDMVMFRYQQEHGFRISAGTAINHRLGSHAITTVDIAVSRETNPQQKELTESMPQRALQEMSVRDLVAETSRTVVAPYQLSDKPTTAFRCDRS